MDRHFFRQPHSMNSTACLICGFDIRNSIHVRTDEPNDVQKAAHIINATVPWPDETERTEGLT